MASIFLPKRRHVLPNFRSFSDTVALGEIAPSRAGVPYVVPTDFDSLLAEWRREPTVGVAADILSSALVSGNSGHAEIAAAAEFVLAHRSVASGSLVDVASQVLGKSEEAVSGTTQLPRLSTFLDVHSTERTRKRVRQLRQATARFPADAILFAELSRQHLILGNGEKAIKSIRTALALAPTNRFVLRSAARVFAHFDDSERAFDLLHRNPRTLRDPWLMSAQLAVAGLIDRQSMVAKRAAGLLSQDLSQFSLAELASGLGSFEMQAGNRRRSRRLFEAALAKPNDNALAQTEWALSIDPLFEFDPKSFDVKRNYEALALDAFNQGEWKQTIEHCESWFMDMPFARRPVMMGSHVATVVLEDYEAGQSFARAGLVSHPDDPQLINNYAYALALDGQADRALEALDRVPVETVEDASTRSCLKATRGLAHFRKGNFEEGRALYQQAIEMASSVTIPSFRQLALLNYAREEMLARQSVPETVIEAIRKLKIDPRLVTVEILRTKVLELWEHKSVATKAP